MLRSAVLKSISEYQKKYNVYFELTGSLYPSIIYRELLVLRANLIEAGIPSEQLPEPPCPDAFGYAPARPKQVSIKHG